MAHQETLSLSKSLQVFVLCAVFGLFRLAHGRRVFSFEMHHRFSEPVRNWSSATGNLRHWPEKGSFEYYADLVHRDRLLRGRRLSDSSVPLIFSDGNSTSKISSLGFLHYTSVELGTPGVKFMVALDTGSDLFWVPCDCNRCASTEGTTYTSEFELGMYNPNRSLTSKAVTCNNSLCTHRNQCPGTFSNCPYTVSYVSAQTSTEGFLVEDVLHLTTEDSQQETVEAFVIFGCGQVQSGSFLDVAAPNGLFGLGMENISVPSVLSREGLIANSFSMCFGHDGIGRISFGDKGSLDQEETPFNVNPLLPTYNITATQVRIGNTLIDEEFTALFDSGTSFTYLVDPVYSSVSENFHLQARDSQRAPDSRIPFQYCYDMSPDLNASVIPNIRLTMKGGSDFTVFDPIIVISTEGELIYCLAVVKSSEMNIIGQNFMTGYRIVFDRESLTLGWKKFDCYDIDKSNKIPEKPHATSVPPPVDADRDYFSTAEEQMARNKSQESDAVRSCSLYISILSYVRIVFIGLYTVLS